MASAYPVLEVAILDVRQGQADVFRSAFAEAEPIIASMPGYGRHELRRCAERDHRFLLLVWWDSHREPQRRLSRLAAVPGVEAAAAPLLLLVPDGRALSAGTEREAVTGCSCRAGERGHPGRSEPAPSMAISRW